MKWNKHLKHAKKSLLTAAICLALSGSAFAMPQGGTVVEGGITGLTGGTLASGGTINVSGIGIIDWNSFGIGSNETLNFAMNPNAALLNRVTGSDISELLGTLNITGGNNWLLVNPNGIIIGQNAVINASNLTLSTLALPNEAFLNDHWTVALPEGRTMAAPIKISHAALNIDHLLDMYGGSIYLDNVTITANGTTHDNDVELHAIQSDTSMNEDQGTFTATPANLISIKDTTYTNANAENGGMNLYGGKIVLDNLTVHGQAVDSGLGSVAAFAEMSGSETAEKTTVEFSATPENRIDIVNSRVEQGGRALELMGGAINAEGLTVDQYSEIDMYAANRIKKIVGLDESEGDPFEDTLLMEYTATPENVLSIKDSDLKTSYDYTELLAGKVEMDGTNLAMKGSPLTRGDDWLQIVAANAYTDSKLTPDVEDVKIAATTENQIALKNGSRLEASDLTKDGSGLVLAAGSLQLRDTQLVNPKGTIQLRAFTNWTGGTDEENQTVQNMQMTPENRIALGNAQITLKDGAVHKGLEILGGTVDLGSSALAADTAKIGAVKKWEQAGGEPTGEAAEGYAIEKGTAIVPANTAYFGNIKDDAPTPEPTPEPIPTPTPEPVPTPDVAAPTESNVNIKAGWEQMNAALQTGATETAVLREVEGVLSDANKTLAEKNRTVAGFLLAIGSSSLTDREKESLADAVVASYTPLAEVQTERRQETDRTQQSAPRAAASLTAPVQADIAVEESAAVPVTGVEE